MRLTQSTLEKIANDYNLTLSKITTCVEHHGKKFGGSHRWKKIGFQFSYKGKHSSSYIEFYGKLTEYNNIDIEAIVMKAIKEFQIKENYYYGSIYYLVRLDEEILTTKQNPYFESEFYKLIDTYIKSQR